MAPTCTFNFAIFDLFTGVCLGGNVRPVDNDKLTSVFMFIEHLATHRLEAAPELLRLELVEGTPEGCLRWDILWLGVVERFTEGVIAPYSACESLERVTLELSQAKRGCAFG